jgi:hypothetical protein
MVFRVQLSAANIGNAAGRCTDFFMLERFFLTAPSCHGSAPTINLRVLL